MYFHLNNILYCSFVCFEILETKLRPPYVLYVHYPGIDSEFESVYLPTYQNGILKDVQPFQMIIVKKEEKPHYVINFPILILFSVIEFCTCQF